MTQTPTSSHPVVSREQWLAARRELLAREKAHTRERDALGAARRALPWVRVDKPYVFTTPAGEKTLAELFAGRSQLIVQHFMLGPGWEEGCAGCSFLADHVDGANQHLPHADATFVAVSRAPLAEIEVYRQRMGWRFPWVSSFGSEFNYDFHVSFTEADKALGKVTYNYTEIDYCIDELHGLSVFAKNDNGDVFHTYSTYARGAEAALGTFMLLDLVPKGRNEEGPMSWMRRHDQYGTPTA